MSLRHALLGLLTDRPASGYELAGRFEGDLGRYAWQAGHTGIYPELVRMAGRGLIEADEAGPRGRKVYSLTEDGRAELRRWLMTPPQQSTVRNETVLRMFLVQTLDPDDARALLMSIAERCAAELDRLRPLMEAEDAAHGTASLPFGRLAGEYGLRQYEAVLGWARWSLDRLAAAGKGSSTA